MGPAPPPPSASLVLAGLLVSLGIALSITSSMVRLPDGSNSHDPSVPASVPQSPTDTLSTAAGASLALSFALILVGLVGLLAAFGLVPARSATEPPPQHWSVSTVTRAVCYGVLLLLLVLLALIVAMVMCVRSPKVVAAALASAASASIEAQFSCVNVLPCTTALANSALWDTVHSSQPKLVDDMALFWDCSLRSDDGNACPLRFSPDDDDDDDEEESRALWAVLYNANATSIGIIEDAFGCCGWRDNTDMTRRCNASASVVPCAPVLAAAIARTFNVVTGFAVAGVLVSVAALVVLVRVVQRGPAAAYAAAYYYSKSSRAGDAAYRQIIQDLHQMDGEDDDEDLLFVAGGFEEIPLDDVGKGAKGAAGRWATLNISDRV